jgi:hypothetical protein
MDDTFTTAGIACSTNSFEAELSSELLAPANLHELKRKYSALLLQLDRLRAGLLSCDVNRPVSSDGWNIKEILGHLIDSDRAIWWPRIESLLVQENPVFGDVDQQALIRRAGWASLPLEDILSQLMRVRWSYAVKLNELNEEDFLRTGQHSAFGELTLMRILQIMVAHDAHYLGKVRNCVEQTQLMAR